MKLRIGRTGTATALVAAAVMLPCAAWYVVGSREAAREAERIVGQPIREAREAAVRATERLAFRLETLRQAESRRPFEHYATASAPDAEQPCACPPDRLTAPAPVPTADPLVRAHFQIDAVGRVTLPDLASPGPEAETSQHAVLESLECAETETLPATRRSGNDVARTLGDTRRPGLILVGPFAWHTLNLDDRPALVSVREVQTPGAVLTQGFVVATEHLSRELEAGPFPLHLAEGPPDSATAAALPIEGARWHVAADASVALGRAEADAKAVRRRFTGTFLAGALGALLAGFLVIGLVWQSERLAAERSRFAAVAAHELRTPLAGLRMYGEMLAEDLGEPDRRRDYARHITQEADRLGRVVGNVLGYTRLERGALALQTAPGALAPAVERVLDAVEPGLGDSGMRLIREIEEGLPQVSFAPDALAQMLQNLLDNAEKHTRGAADRTVRVRVRAVPEGAAVEVRDHGPGVPRRIRRAMFRPFVRDGSRDAPGGIGLGLAMVRALAREQGAALAYRDAEGGGAAFELRFPAHRAG